MLNSLTFFTSLKLHEAPLCTALAFYKYVNVNNTKSKEMKFDSVSIHSEFSSFS